MTQRFFCLVGLWTALLVSACSKGESVPPWAAGVKASEFRQFREIIVAIPNAKADFVAATLRLDTLELGLKDLLEICYYLDVTEWKTAATEWVADSRAADLLARSGDFARLAPKLALRLIPDAAVGKGLMGRPALPGIHSLVVIRHGSALRPVSATEAGAWGRNADEIYQIALANIPQILKGSTAIQHEAPLTYMAGAAFLRVVGTSALTPSLILAPTSLSGYRDGSHGIWSVPNSRTVLYAPLETVEASIAATFMVQTLLRDGALRPDALSSDIFVEIPKPQRRFLMMPYVTNSEKDPVLKPTAEIEAIFKSLKRH